MKYFFNSNGIEALNKYIFQKNPSKIFVLTDTNTRVSCLPVFKNYFSFEFTNVNTKSGDENKNINSLIAIWETLMKKGADRKSLLINLGGGVVTDIGGFAATGFKRGIDFIHIPTTLLGMVDAAIGGKNGINFMQAKNQIGTIVQPQFVWINTVFLDTLPQTELDSGFAEMLKHGLIADETYWNKLIANYHYFNNPQQPKVLNLIKKSVEIKDQVIKADPYEKGWRKILNFGHTLGHAIETHFNYNKKQKLSHGHAVAVGMILAAYLSEKITGLSMIKAEKIKKSLQVIYPKLDFRTDDIRIITDLLNFDKKNERGKINFVLLEQIGKPVLDQQVPDKLIIETFDFYKS